MTPFLSKELKEQYWRTRLSSNTNWTYTNFKISKMIESVEFSLQTPFGSQERKENAWNYATMICFSTIFSPFSFLHSFQHSTFNGNDQTYIEFNHTKRKNIEFLTWRTSNFHLNWNKKNLMHRKLLQKEPQEYFNVKNQTPCNTPIIQPTSSS